ncbi:MAG TPA: DHH family phosphoesterase [Patescibacteria group bacterium]|nr:DHH family phosphoesterase [Patescibacteria group bacterium]
MEIQQDFTDAHDLIIQSKNILLTTHESTDGDDFGTVSALALYIQSLGRQATFAINGDIPKQLSYLPTASWQLATQDTGFDLVIASGCSNKKRINIPWIEALEKPFINFDHHIDNTRYGTVNVVDAAKSSVAELVYDFFKFLKVAITSQMATCMLTGIFTDTGSFMHSSTQSSTYVAAGELLKLGANMPKIARWNYKNKTKRVLKAWGQVIQDAQINPKNNLIFSAIPREGNPLPNSSYEGLVETLVKAEEAKFSLLLKEDGEFVKGSLRSDPHKNIDVQKIASKMGGGGHKWASGFKLKAKLKKTDKGFRVEK